METGYKQFCDCKEAEIIVKMAKKQNLDLTKICDLLLKSKKKVHIKIAKDNI